MTKYCAMKYLYFIHIKTCSASLRGLLFVTFKAVTEDVFQDGGKVDELFGGVVDGLSRVLFQERLDREP